MIWNEMNTFAIFYILTKFYILIDFCFRVYIRKKNAFPHKEQQSLLFLDFFKNFNEVHNMNYEFNKNIFFYREYIFYLFFNYNWKNYRRKIPKIRKFQEKKEKFLNLAI